MKKGIILLALVLLVNITIVNAQDAEYKRNQSIYSKALTYNDFDVAKIALYNMMELKPGNIGLLDTLSLLYFEQQQYVSAAIVAQEAAKKNPNNTVALEIAGTSFENIGLNDKALEHFELLYLKKADINILYKMAFLQYRMKRYNEATVSTDMIVKDPKSNDIKLVFSKKDNTRQQISMIAATYRLKGLIAFDKNEKDKAISLLKKALEYDPDFEIVSTAISQIEK